MSSMYRDGTPKENSKSVLFTVLEWGVSVVVLGALGFFAWQYFDRPKPIPSSSAEVITAVGKLIELPSGTPSVTTISDDKLKSQPFFANVKQGDKMLVYAEARKVLVYRPTTGKLINVGPILNDSTGQPGQSSESNESSQSKQSITSGDAVAADSSVSTKSTKDSANE